MTPQAQLVTDVVDAAARIARSAAGEVDWAREPVTDRERRVRARWLARRLQGDMWGATDICCHALVLRASEAVRGNRAFELPGDLASAEMAARAIRDAFSTVRESAEIAHIMQELDEEETSR